MAATQAMTGPGRLADDLLPHPGGRAVPLRHLLPATRAGLPPAARRRHDGLARRRRAGARRGRADRRHGWPTTPRRRCRPRPSTPTRSTEPPSQTLREGFDARHGGFGGAPKFPPSMVAGVPAAPPRAHRLGRRAARWSTLTCERMARGGMYDQLAGGFARYSVDARWVVPHFEKMLYDNALLLRGVRPPAPGVTGAALARRVAEETAAFLLRDLRTAEGGFASALDADTDGVEGLTYAWTPAQLARGARRRRRRLGRASCSRSPPAGTFEHGASTLQLPVDPDDPARWARVRAALLAAARAARPQPARDDKVVTAWNGLAIARARRGRCRARAARSGSPPPRGPPICCWTGTSSTGGCAAPRATASVGAAAGRAGGPRAASPTALLALHQATGAPAAGSRPRRSCSTSPWRTSPTGDPAPSSTPPTTRRRCCTGPREITDNATPVRRLARWPPRCSRRRCWSTDGRPVPGGGRGGAARRRARSLRRAPAVRRALAHRGRGAGARARCRSRSSAPDRAGSSLDARAAHRPRAAPWSSPATPDAPGVPLLAAPAARRRRAAAYVCRGFVCDRPVTTARRAGRRVRPR